MGRIDDSKDMVTIVSDMSEGNPGAITAMIEMGQSSKEDGNPLGMLYPLMFLDSLEIYGTDIYVLWSDICDKNADFALKVLEASQKETVLTPEILKDACSRQDYSGKEIVMGLMKENS